MCKEDDFDVSEEIQCDVLYEETSETEVYFHSFCEDIRGFLPGKSVEEILAISARIEPCTCGGKAELHEYEGMGDGDYIICCKECGRTLRRGSYDVDIHSWEEVLEFCIRDWNAGLCWEDIKKVNQAEHERIRIREEDLQWVEYHPNNIKSNPLEGFYSLMFMVKDDKIYCCKWTIQFQWEEVEPGVISRNSPINAYNLFLQRYFEVNGPMCYPELSEHFDWKEDGEKTFTADGVNSAGDFVYSYRTLEEAKLGAAGRCGWQGLNRDTILREEEYRGKTAEEVLAAL